MPTTKFKKVRLFKVSRELNVTVDTLREYIEEHDYTDALKGKGLNASITDEEVYFDLLETFASNKEMRERLQEKRAARAAEMEAEKPVVSLEDGRSDGKEEAAEAEEEPEEPVAEAADTVDEVDEEPEAEAAAAGEDVATEAPEEEVTEEPVAEDEVQTAAADEGEAVAEEDEQATAEEEAQVAAKEETDVETPAAEEELEEDKQEAVAEAAAEDEVDEEAEEEEPEVEAAADEEDEPEATEADGEEDDESLAPESVLTADRFKLRGTKMVGKVDIKSIKEKSRRRRKRKRTSKSKDGDDDTRHFQSQSKRSSKKSKKQRKKKRQKFDEEDVEEKLQNTLRELEQGVSRIRQRRRRRRRERHEEERLAELEEQQETANILRITEYISTGELANLMEEDVNDVIGTLLGSGMMVSINQRLDADTISYVADEYGYEVEFISEFSDEEIQVEEDAPEDLVPRAPVVTVMGHVDHGKTSLLDYIRKANVVAGEAGGITQHIGAYRVKLDNDRSLTFLDTPGHEAFTAMRARGAQATDVVILVVAANDAVMPQTVEAINHAQAADVPIIVAINKMDLPEASPQKVMQELADNNVLVEQYGGKVQCSEVSAMTGDGVDDLLDKVLLESEILELQANPERNASGVVIESRMQKGRGNVATVLVQNGSLRVGDPFVAGINNGRVRAMFDERDNEVEQVGPSEPALVLGFTGASEVGDQFIVLEEESEARDIAQRRQQIHREQALRQRKHITLDEIGRRIAIGDFQELNLILKADVGGSVEALADSLLKLSTEEVAVNIIHTGIGAITENDVMLASASDAVILGFQVRPAAGARLLADREEIDVRTYSVIYEAVEDVHDALEGLLSPDRSEEVNAVVEVRDIFKVPKVGTVAGCFVTEGAIHRNDRVRVVRDGVVIYEGTLGSLKRYKEDVREVQTGYECGMSVENFNDIKVGDTIEAYEIIETARRLEEVG